MSEDRWEGAYFNYFTEIEEHFQRARGTSLFLMSPLDWALVEGWKNTGVPLEAVLRGIDDAFEKYRSRKRKTAQQVNSLAYCAQAVTQAAEDMLNNRAPRKAAPSAEESLPNEALRAALAERIPELESRGFSTQAEAVRAIGEAKAAAYRAGAEAMGQQGFTAVQLMQIVGDQNVRIIPEIAVNGGGSGQGGGSLVEALLGMMLRSEIQKMNTPTNPDEPTSEG